MVIPPAARPVFASAIAAARNGSSLTWQSLPYLSVDHDAARSTKRPRLQPKRPPDFLSHPTDILITMSNDTIEPQPLIDPFDDPVTYLAQFGLSAELVVFEELALPLAA